MVDRKCKGTSCGLPFACQYFLRLIKSQSTILLLAFLLLNSNCQTMQTKGTVKGIVHDQSGKPLNDAIVLIVSGSSEFNDIASVSNENGEFHLSNITIPGKYVLQIQKDGQQKNKEVDIQHKDLQIEITF